VTGSLGNAIAPLRQRRLATRGSDVDFLHLPPLAVWDRRLSRLVPIVFALSTGFQITKYIVVPAGIGFDARLYTDATRAWLAGGDPWAVSDLGVRFGAPPPTLVAFIPFVIFPDWLVSAMWVAGSFALAWLAIRAIGLPLWWIAFWPIMDGAMVGNPDVAVLALIVVARQRFDWLAPVLKVYAAFPMFSMARWRSIIAAAIALLLTAPFLPWSLWASQLESISANLQATAQTTSVFGSPVLMALAVIALAILGVRRAGWFIVAVLWPYTQQHYLAMSVPALTPMLAIVWSIPRVTPEIILGSVIAAAIGFRFAPGLHSPTLSQSQEGGDSQMAAQRI
jgi:hypothetical protein